MSTRRDHLKHMAGAMALPLLGTGAAQAFAEEAGSPASTAGGHHYLGRTGSYRE